VFKFLFAVAAALGIAAIAYGAAASLNVTGGTLQSGNSATAACETSSLSVQYNFDDITEGPAFANPTVSSIQVSPIDAACVGKQFLAYVYDGSNNLVARTQANGDLNGDASQSCVDASIAVGASTLTAGTFKRSLCATDGSGNEVDSLVLASSVDHVNIVIN
jgi:hypothetical protein